jgi:DnaJ family protein A protein 2
MKIGSHIEEEDKCEKCNGVGVIEEEKTLEVQISKGSTDGDTILLEGEADQLVDL